MNCFNHSETPAIAYCRVCGKALCAECKRTAQGTIFCDEHVPATANAAPPSVAAPSPAAVPPPAAVLGEVSPGLACLLGFIPGVGAIYNGQYAKGLVHAVIFGVLVSILNSSPDSLQIVFGIFMPVWVFYMAFEAYHTARKRAQGEPVDEYSSIINLGGAPENAAAAGIVLVVLGVLLLLHTLHLFDLEYLTRYWPVLLIAAGAYLLYSRFAGQHSSEKEMGHER